MQWKFMHYDNTLQTGDLLCLGHSSLLRVNQESEALQDHQADKNKQASPPLLSPDLRYIAAVIP